MSLPAAKSTASGFAPEAPITEPTRLMSLAADSASLRPPPEVSGYRVTPFITMLPDSLPPAPVLIVTLPSASAARRVSA